MIRVGKRKTLMPVTCIVAGGQSVKIDEGREITINKVEIASNRAEIEFGEGHKQWAKLSWLESCTIEVSRK